MMLTGNMLYEIVQVTDWATAHDENGGKKTNVSKDVELLILFLRPHYLPKEFSKVYVTTIYTPSDANSENVNDTINTNMNDLMAQCIFLCDVILKVDLNPYLS